MTTAMTVPNEADRILDVLVTGNLSVLKPEERVDYFNRVCTSLGLNPLTKPFEFLTLNGKLVLYATKACTDQLRQIHGVSIAITQQQQMGDVYMVTVTATDKGGRQDSDMGVVAANNLKGEALANAMLKAITKAKRRVTLSICGLGMLDETEVDDIPAASKRPAVVMPQPKVDTETGEVTVEPSVVPDWLVAFNANRKDLGISNDQISAVLGKRLSVVAIQEWLDADETRTPDRLLSLAADQKQGALV